MLPNIKLFLDQLTSERTYSIIHDSRGIAPGGPIQIDITNDRKTIASLVVKTMDPIGVAPEDLNNYVVTEVTIDNATVLKPSHRDTPQTLCVQISNIIRAPHLPPQQKQPFPASRAGAQSFGRHFQIKHRCKFVAALRNAPSE